MKLKKLEELNKPYKIYAEYLESGAIDQFVNVMSLPDVVQGALMPDAHSGYVLPIGAVVSTAGTIYPSFVGYDIGCGMFSVKLLGVTKEELINNAETIRDKIFSAVPVGFSKNENLQEASKWLSQKLLPKHSSRINDILGHAPNCIGTLGGGNHFIEIGYDEEDQVWLTIHSGSRSIGHGIASLYMKMASGDDGKAESACHLLETSEEGRDYILDLEYGLQFALANREYIAQRVCSVNGFTMDGNSIINRNHNHAEFKDNLWIHRKGATHADEGMMGVIPGNMRDGCFIVRGKGNPESMNSSSHGAGRVMSRSKAKKEVTLESFKESMKDIPGATVGESTIDESPFAYKDIFDVMRLQEDLVEVLHYIKPVVNVKG